MVSLCLLYVSVKENRVVQKRGWKVVKKDRDSIFYKEKVNEEWKSIVIDGELLLGKINFVIYFKTKEEWK
ncbi:hypothetical protein [Pontimicrobium sp. MEBiC06410]